MSFFRNLHLSSRLLLGLFAAAVGVAVGGEVLRPGHHVHVGAGGHHHHWFLGPHVHEEQSTTATLPHRHDITCEVAGAHSESGAHAEGHHHNLPDNDRPGGGPPPSEQDNGAFVDTFPFEEATSHIVLGMSLDERGASLQSALSTRATTPDFLPITPRGPPTSPLFV